MKAERPENHTKMASGGLLGGFWGAPGAQEAFLQMALLHVEPFWAAPGGVRRPSGEPLGPLWALSGRLLALPGVFFEVSEAISEAVGQEA